MISTTLLTRETRIQPSLHPPFHVLFFYKEIKDAQGSFVGGNHVDLHHFQFKKFTSLSG